MNKEKSEQLTKEEMDFLEEQHDIYREKYENYAYLLRIAESIDTIKNIYE